MCECYGVEVFIYLLCIVYCEMIVVVVEGYYCYKKQIGGVGQFGEVLLKVELLVCGGGFEFVDVVKGGVIFGQFLLVIEKGVCQVMDYGVLVGFFLQDVCVIVLDGKYYVVDFKEVVFISVGCKVFFDVVGKVWLIVFELIVDVQVVIFEQYVGDIIGGFVGKCVCIFGIDLQCGGELLICVQVLLVELVDYVIELCVVIGGCGCYSMELSYYELVLLLVQK